MNLGSARQSKIDPTERDHCTLCKASEEGQVCKAAASANSQNLTERGILSLGMTPFKKLDFPFVLYGLGSRIECAEISALACFRVFGARIKSIFTGG